MIRVNLLGKQRPKVKRRVAIPGGLQAILLVIPVAVAIIALVFHYLMIQSQIGELREQVTQKQAEKRELAQIEEEIQQLEEERKRLDERQKAITTLRQNQQGPVRLLTAVGDTVSLTATLWLTQMEETAPNQLEFTGRAGSVNAVANFISNLNQSGFFQNVEIQESVEQPGEDGAPPTFEFVLTAQFIPPARQPQPEQEAASAPAAAGGGR